MDAVRGIWLYVYEPDGAIRSSKWPGQPGVVPGSPEDIDAARNSLKGWVASAAAQLREYNDGDCVIFGVFFNEPPDPWLPDTPSDGSWRLHESTESPYRPEWNEEVIASLMGAYVLVGLTTVERNGAEHKEQFHGTITACDRNTGIGVLCAGNALGITRVLPPDTAAWKPADLESDYRLRSTGEVISGVQFIATWKVEEPT